MNGLTEMLQVENDTLRMFLQAGAIIVAGYVLSKIVHLIVKIIQHRITSKTETDLDDRIIGVLEKSIQRIINVTALYIAAMRIENVYQGKWVMYLDGAFFVIMVVFITMLMSSLVKAVMEWYVAVIAVRTQSQVDEELVPLVKRVANLLLYSIGLVICLDHFHIDIKALVVSLGVGSFAIAFAAQETLANMIAGFVILVDRPFRVGDRIEIATGVVGDVREIGLRSTRLLMFDNNLLVIPNAELVKSRITNLSYPDPPMRVLLRFEVAYGSDLKPVRAILLEAAGKHPDILQDPPPQVAVTGTSERAVELTLVARAKSFALQWGTETSIREEVYGAFLRQGIGVPVQRRVVQLQHSTPSVDEH